jgi:hypothetical protein
LRRFNGLIFEKRYVVVEIVFALDVGSGGNVRRPLTRARLRRAATAAARRCTVALRKPAAGAKQRLVTQHLSATGSKPDDPIAQREPPPREHREAACSTYGLEHCARCGARVRLRALVSAAQSIESSSVTSANPLSRPLYRQREGRRSSRLASCVASWLSPTTTTLNSRRCSARDRDSQTASTSTGVDAGDVHP